MYIYIYGHAKNNDNYEDGDPEGAIPVTVGTAEACQGNAAQDPVTPRRAPTAMVWRLCS